VTADVFIFGQGALTAYVYMLVMLVNARSVVDALAYRPDQLQVVLMLVTSEMSRAMECQSASAI
jgi:hypothetical protein